MTHPLDPDFDQDALIAGVDLMGRSGARNIEIGYLHDDVPIEEAGWYAQASYNGARLIAEDKPGPVEAVEALARKMLRGARCRRCGKMVELSDGGTGCRWRREGPGWVPGCGLDIDQSIELPSAVRRD
jgi:hypothetical protein